MTSIRDSNIFHNRDLEDLYKLQADLEVAQGSNKPYYLKIVSSGSDKKVVLVQGRFNRLIASISCFFGVKSYNLNNVKQLICNEFESVKQASATVTNKTVGAKLALSCEGVSRIFLTCISSDKCLNTKVDDKDHLSDRINTLVHSIKDHFHIPPNVSPPMRRDVVLRTQLPSEPIKDSPELFVEQNQTLLQRCLGNEMVENLKAVKDEGQLVDGLKTALEGTLLELVGIRGAHDRGAVAALLTVGQGIIWNGPFKTAGTKEHACYQLIREKLDGCFDTLKNNDAISGRLSAYKEVAQRLAQAKALLQVHVEKKQQPDLERMVLALELEAFATKLEGNSELAGAITALKTADLENAPKSQFEAVVNAIHQAKNTPPETAGWLAVFDARIQRIEDKIVEAPVVADQVEAKILNEAEKKAYLQEMTERARGPLLRLGVELDAILQDERLSVDEKINEYILAIPDNHDKINEFVVKQLNTLDKSTYPIHPGSISNDLWQFLLANVTRHDAYKRYEPNEAIVEKRILDVKDCAQFLDEALILCDAASEAPTFEVAQAKRSVLLMELRHLAYRLDVDEQSRLWEQLADDPLYNHDKPYSQSRHAQITTEELKGLYEKLCQLKPDASLLKDEWISHLESLQQFEKTISLDAIKPRKSALELEKEALDYVKAHVVGDARFLAEAKCFAKVQTAPAVQTPQQAQYSRAVTLIVLRQLLIDAGLFLESQSKSHPLSTYTKAKIEQLMIKLAAGESSSPFTAKRLSTIGHTELELLALECVKALEPLQSYSSLNKSARWMAFGPKRREVNSLV